jgi:hypothetical protein
MVDGQPVKSERDRMYLNIPAGRTQVVHIIYDEGIIKQKNQ